MPKLNVLVAGSTGYIGIQLIRLLVKHSKIRIKYLCGNTSVGKKISAYDKNLKTKKLPKIIKFNKKYLDDIDIIFTALPNGEAQKIAKKKTKVVKLIDLSADFRLKKSKEYKNWYGIEHQSKDLIKSSIYSITEFKKNILKNYNIISCPGCYPTSIQIPLIPLVKKKMINIHNIIVDSKSGYSGAGKNIKKKHNYKNLFESVSAYGVGKHRHMSEIDQEISNVAKKKVHISFTPHLLPMFRGILSTIYVDVTKKNNAIKIFNYLKNYHKKNVFVKFAKFDSTIGTGEVMNTNFCKISVCKTQNPKRIIIISCIDNLVKGASGQAVQNMNIAFNLNETMGLV